MDSQPNSVNMIKTSLKTESGQLLILKTVITFRTMFISGLMETVSQ